MKVKAQLIGAFFIISSISAFIFMAPTTQANTSKINRTQNSSKSAKVWQILTNGSCTPRNERKRTNISRARNDSCTKISR
jgi:anionic cell wall polymer biosynthesis LytR-Cps2A-Psr (LCP) family protein